MGLFGIRSFVDYEPYKGISAWRKVTLGTWTSPSEGSVYGAADFEAEGILKLMQDAKSQGLRLTPTMVVAKALADNLVKTPSTNAVIRLGRVYRRKDMDVFLSVSGEDMGDDLSGVLIRKCDQKSLEEISKEVSEKVANVKSGTKDDFKKSKSMMNWIPGFLVRPIIRFLEFVQHVLNLWIPFLGPRDPMGSIIVTSMGMFGVTTAFAPLVPYSRCSLIFAVGKIEDKAVVENSEVIVRPYITINVTFDHRLVDGRTMGKVLNNLTTYFQELN